MSHYQEIADLQRAAARSRPGEIIPCAPSQFDMVQEAAARRMAREPAQTAPEGIAQTVVAAVHGDERAAYAYLDDLTRAVNTELRRNTKGT